MPDSTGDFDRAVVIIVTRNRAELLRRSVRSVLRQQPRASRLIVVDDASTDHTARVLQEECPDATVIRLSKNVGWSAARNFAAAAADREVLFFLDDDGELAPDAVAAAARTMLADHRIGALVATVIEDGKPIFASGRARIFTNVCYGQGALRRAAFTAVGMYPADFAYAEEMDLSLRLLDAGYHIVHDPAVVTFHSPDPRSRRPLEHVEVQRNMLRVVLMRAPLTLMIPWALKKVCDTLIAALRTGRPRVVAAELLALPRALIRGSSHRRPLAWQVFAVWRHLARGQVTSDAYRTAALREYPTRWRLLLGYLRGDL
jgi:GT2 family glycosyltransferase